MPTKTYGLLAAAIAMGLIAKIGAEYVRKLGREKKRGTITSKNVLTKNEQPMFFRLAEALPEYVVLCQVAFSALLDTNDRSTRNTFNRKVADFVICRKSFSVVAIIELDDRSHDGQAERDKERDALLTEAGHKVLRYKTVPDADTVRNDLKSLLSAG